MGADVTADAPARVARNMKLPEVSGAPLSVCPFVLASRYPNGAVAVSAIGRNVGREYVTEKSCCFDIRRPLGHTYRTIWLFQRSDNGVSFSIENRKAYGFCAGSGR